MNRSTRLVFAATLLVTATVTGIYLFDLKRDRSAPIVLKLPDASISPAEKLLLHPVVQKIVSEGPELPYLKFNYLIKELPNNLSPHNIDALIDFISGPRPPKFQEAEWGSLTNDIEECLTGQTVPSEKVARALIAIFRDSSKIQMQRDYALQHVGGFAIHLVHTSRIGQEELSPLADSDLPNLHTPIFKSLLAELKSAAAQVSRPWSGTALNMLDSVLRTADSRAFAIPGLTAEELVALAIQIARDPSAPLNARLPALQVAARRDSPIAGEIAREILSSPDSGLMLVQSASAALARLGTTEDLPLLQTASASATRHTALALNEAIQSIQARATPGR